MYDYLVISMGYDGDWEISYYTEDRDEAKKVFESRWSRFAFYPIIVLAKIDKRDKERSKYSFHSDEIVILDIYVSEKIEDDFDIYSYIGKTIKRLVDDLKSYWGRSFSVAKMSKIKKLSKTETIVRNENLGIEIYYDISTKDIVIDVIDKDVALEQLEGMSEGEFLEESGLERKGFSFVYGDELGELSDVLILTDFVDFDDYGKIVDIGNIWIYEDYYVKDFIEELRKGKSVIFKNYEESKIKSIKLGGKKKKKVARDFRVSVRDGEIWGYTERGTTAFRISEVAEGVYEAEDYLGGWISPKLDILGAWNLAQDVGVTEEEFERAFGKLPDSMTVDFDEFVSWFFRAGQLPKGVIIDTGVGENLLQMVIEGIEEQVLYDLEERLTELGEEMDRDIAGSIVFDYVMDIGVYEAVNMMSNEDILRKILEPVFGDYIEIDNRNKTVTLNTKEFFEFANTHEATMGLIEALQDVLDTYLYERYSLDELISLYEEKQRR